LEEEQRKLLVVLERKEAELEEAYLRIEGL
jgi:hypothetical protein